MGQKSDGHPEAGLLKTMRLANRLSIPKAAAKAGISHQRWGQIERSEHGRAPADTVAHMAHAVGVRPKRLIDLDPEDARLREVARILVEIERQKAAGVPPAERDVQELIKSLPEPERSVVEEMLKSFLDRQERERAAFAKVVTLLAPRRRSDDGDRSATG